ncbi:MAG: penicillin-binding transpeptidase domain-containing protein, partial [bacterium]
MKIHQLSDTEDQPLKKKSRRIESVSGLHPAPIFVFFALAFVLVAGAALRLCLLEPGEQPNTARRTEAPTPAFWLLDLNGAPLARSVEVYTLSVSPRALLLVHTPWRIAKGLASLLEGAAVVTDDSGLTLSAQVMARILPQGVAAQDGWLASREPRMLRFDAQKAALLKTWIRQGAGLLKRPVQGIAVQPIEASDDFTLAWAPTLLLAEAQRMEALGKGGAGHPERWTKHLLNGIGQTLGLLDEDNRVELEALPPALASKLRRQISGDQALRLRDALWAELMPTEHRVVVHGVNPVRAATIREWMAEERVYSWQLSLTPLLERRHTTSAEGDASVPMGEPPPDNVLPDSFAILGHWGTLGPTDARSWAKRNRDQQPWLLAWDAPADPFGARRYDLENNARPWSGLEYLAGKLLAQPLWQDRIQQVGRTYERGRRSVARDRKGAWPDEGGLPDFYLDANPAVAPPSVVSTLRADLQQALHLELSETLQRTGAARVDGIVLDVESGDVLAVGSESSYALSGFPPTQFRFTPGSIMKALVMAIALNAGVVRPDEMFRTFAPDGIELHDGRARRRIREAEGAPQDYSISAAQALSQSVNAVMVQIGRRIEPRVFRGGLVGLGLGRVPGAGLGPESAGYLPPLKKGSWNPTYTHASVSFGHEISVTLWQMAGALATIARGGGYRPLRMVREVRQGRERWPIEPEAEVRVLSFEACKQTLDMMRMGAMSGTGARVVGGGALEELAWFGSKTGTTEKEEGVPCSHLEAEHQLHHRQEGSSCSSSCFRTLRGKRSHSDSCYTSSMCLLGRLTQDGPMVLVLVVVDERGKGSRYGADAAG